MKKTIKEKFIEACEQIANEYKEEGHERSYTTCPMCLIYFSTTCKSCPIARNQMFSGCLYNLTNKKQFNKKVEEIKDKLCTKNKTRSIFYSKLAKEAENIDKRYFTPSVTIRNNKIRNIARGIDRDVYEQYKDQYPKKKNIK